MEIKNSTHSAVIVEQEGGLRLVEITPNEGEPDGKRFYIVHYDERTGQVTTVLAKDRPPKSSGGHAWVARGLSPSSVAYVAGGMNQQTAMRHWQSVKA